MNRREMLACELDLIERLLYHCDIAYFHDQEWLLTSLREIQTGLEKELKEAGGNV